MRVPDDLNYAVLYGLCIAGAGLLFVLNAAIRISREDVDSRLLFLAIIGVALSISAIRTLINPAAVDVDPERPGLAVVGAIGLLLVALASVVVLFV